MKSKPGRFEQMISRWCHEMGHPEVRWVLPDTSLGSASVFLRDADMVRAADLVLAFFAPGKVMEGGTGHVVEAAMSAGVPVYSWTIETDIVRVGEHDPDAIWQGMINDWFQAE